MTASPAPKKNGSLIGITRESTTRALVKFQKKGYLQISGSEI